MEQNSTKSSPVLTGADILKLLLKRIKFIVCITLIVTIIGGTLFTFDCLSNCVYGNDVDFYITKGDGKQVLLPLLDSESFSEKLLLDEYGLPEEYAGTPEYEAAKQAVITFNEARIAKSQSYKELTLLPYALKTPKDPTTGETIYSFAVIDAKYEALTLAYQNAYELLSTYKSAAAEGLVTEEHIAKIAVLEQQLEQARAEKDLYEKTAYAPAVEEQAIAQARYSLDARIVTDTRKIADELVESVVAKWREDPDVQIKIRKITEALSFSYAKYDVTTASTTVESDNISFLTVSVRVSGDEDLAQFILDRIAARLPDFAEKNIERLESVTDTDCILISPYSRTVNPDRSDMTKTIAVSTVIVFVVTAALICLIIVAKEWLKIFNPKAEKPKNNESKS